MLHWRTAYLCSHIIPESTHPAIICTQILSSRILEILLSTRVHSEGRLINNTLLFPVPIESLIVSSATLKSKWHFRRDYLCHYRMCGKQNRTDSSRTGVVLAGVCHVFIWALGRWISPTRKKNRLLLSDFLWSVFIKPWQVFPEQITMLHLPQWLMLSMSDELAYTGQQSKC